MRKIQRAFAAVRRFAKDNSGAVTVDWVAMTAAVVIIGIGIVYTVMGTDSSGVGGVVSGLTDELGQTSANISGAIDSSLPTSSTE